MSLESATPMTSTNHESNPRQLPLPVASVRAGQSDELATIKQELLKAEVKLAKARAAAAGAEVDIKVLTARLKAITK